MLVPFLLYRSEDPLVLQFGIRMFYDLSNIVSIILDVVLPQVDDSEGHRVLQMWSFNKSENLDPVSCLQRFSSEIFQKLDNQGSLLHLKHDNLIKWSALLLQKVILRQLLIKITIYLVDRSDNLVCVESQERCVIAHVPSFSPIQQHFP